MENTNKNIVVEKIIELPKEQVLKVLIFMAGLEAGCNVDNLERKEMQTIVI